MDKEEKGEQFRIVLGLIISAGATYIFRKYLLVGFIGSLYESLFNKPISPYFIWGFTIFAFFTFFGVWAKVMRESNMEQSLKKIAKNTQK